MTRLDLERELERLHAESWGWALACCARRRDAAEDVLQTAYGRVLSGAATFSGRSAFRTWLFGVIRLVALEHSRGRRVADVRGAPLDWASGVADSRRPADAVLEDDERAAALTRALSKLSPRQRDVLQLVFYHDMTIEEAAVVMKTSLGSARTHYDRAKKALADLLAGVAQ